MNDDTKGNCSDQTKIVNADAACIFPGNAIVHVAFDVGGDGDRGATCGSAIGFWVVGVKERRPCLVGGWLLAGGYAVARARETRWFLFYVSRPSCQATGGRHFRSKRRGKPSV